MAPVVINLPHRTFIRWSLIFLAKSCQEPERSSMSTDASPRSVTTRMNDPPYFPSSLDLSQYLTNIYSVELLTAFETYVS